MAKTTAPKNRRLKAKPRAEKVLLKSAELQHSKLVSETLLECIRTGDLASFREVLVSSLMTVNKLRLAKNAGIGRRTLYDLIDPKRNFNPELSTVSAVIRALAQEGAKTYVL